MPKPLDTPPYHAIPTVGTVIMTFGGLKVDRNLEVCTEGGVPIPGLFACGDLIGGGQLMGESFAGGLGLGNALTFGRIAGRQAASRAKAAGG
jgi:tricarballylate dehydrogenase